MTRRYELVGGPLDGREFTVADFRAQCGVEFPFGGSKVFGPDNYVRVKPPARHLYRAMSADDVGRGVMRHQGVLTEPGPPM